MKSYYLVFFLVLAVIIPSIMANNCGGNCPSNRCPSCPCGTAKNMVDINAQCARHSWGIYINS